MDLLGRLQVGFSGLCGGKFTACRPDELPSDQIRPARVGLIDEWDLIPGT
jgi:hypothetical protein